MLIRPYINILSSLYLNQFIYIFLFLYSSNIYTNLYTIKIKTLIFLIFNPLQIGTV